MDAPLVILGAGLGGLALAAALRAAGVREHVIVLERRDELPDDRTWGTWQAGPTPLAGLATASWRSWAVHDGTGPAVATGPATPYLRLRAGDVRDHLLDRTDAELHLGTRVLGVEDSGSGPVVVQTSDGEIEAHTVFDALALSGPAGRARQTGRVELHQRFLGWDVEVDRPVFDPGVATLMDFRVPQEDGIRFVYVLPESPTRALVEDTSIGGTPVPSALRRAALERYLEQLGAGDFEVLREERGDLLMSDGRFSSGTWGRVVPIGTAAGAIRPSSGYAFSRTLRHVDAVAAAVAADAPRAPRPPGRATLQRMDGLLLRVLADHPERAPALFAAMVRNVPGEAFARFMCDVPRPSDIARMVAALPPEPFVRAAFAGGRVRRPAGSLVPA